MASVALVTGAGRPFGERVAARLSTESSIGRIIAVDTVPPRAAQAVRVEFVRADIRHPLIGTVLDQADVDTVVHTRTRDDGLVGLTTLLAACERSRSLTRLVVQSGTDVYASSASARAVCDETVPVDDPAEAMVRAFARHRPDVTVTVLRLADLVGRGLDSPLMRHLARGVVPDVFGFDARLQLLHIDDAVDVTAQACVERHPGAVNVAARDVLTVAQLARRTGRLRLGLPPVAAGAFARSHRYGRVVDTTLLGTRFGFVPRWSGTQALAAAFAGERAGVPALALGVLSAAERLVGA